MPRGGSRNRSGPKADPNSGRSDRRGYKVDSLPAEGFTGRVPAYPLDRWDFVTTDAEGEIVIDEKLSKAFRKREIALWRELWRTPQACAWILEENHWRHRIVANYCRLSVRCEAPTAPASAIAQLHRFADQIGLTTAGLSEMGWRIAPQSPAEAQSSTPTQQQSSGGSKHRLKVVQGGA